ncbi:3D domain-containing protein [Paenibacillus sp. Y412MC10]|uniref:3D domain-containing protein n=1 Tax=Geobacillus sp. (strain Y412MC10) TaxID=481743 RepID=UPI0011AB7599|nr:3D domain-containing protein [Paenibacillus sp. Y412MC10]
MGAIRLDNIIFSAGQFVRSRWAKLCIVGALFTGITCFTISSWNTYHASQTSVQLLVDGKKLDIRTKSKNVSEMLQEELIPLSKYDYISVPLKADLINGMTIDIRYAKPFTVTYKGASYSFMSTAKTVGAALDDVGVALGPDDKTYPVKTAALVKGDDIQIQRIDKNVEQLTNTLPMQTISIYDDTLPSGVQRVVQPGIAGQIQTTKEQTFQNGTLINEQNTGSVELGGQPQIVVIGTKVETVQYTKKYEPVVETKKRTAQNTKKYDKVVPTDTGQNKQVLHNFELTAYSNDFVSTGKNKGDDGYGITKSGAKTVEGRTIAVDPDVIPLGWWVYIEGLGYRRAEDTGSAIKGNIIDVYFDSEDYAKIFGRKHGYTVTIIGPNKPDEN